MKTAATKDRSRQSQAVKRRPDKIKVARNAKKSTPVAPTSQPAPGAAPTRKPAPEPPRPPERKPGYQQAIALYEGAVRLLQRHEFAAAAEQFRAVISGYPDERELLERARLYLRVCERETTRQPKPAPRTLEERIYAATMALNAGDVQVALSYLQQALDENPGSDHGHYIMAVALSDAGNRDEALSHLQRAIELNPDNRSLALQDPDLEALRGLERFAEAVDAAVVRRAPAQERERKARRR